MILGGPAASSFSEVPMTYESVQTPVFKDYVILDPTDELVINPASVPDVEDDDLPLVLPDLVDRTVVAYPEAIEPAQLQEFSLLRIRLQLLQPVDNPLPLRLSESFQRLLCLRMQEDLLAQPTSSRGIRISGLSLASLLLSMSVS